MVVFDLKSRGTMLRLIFFALCVDLVSRSSSSSLPLLNRANFFETRDRIDVALFRERAERIDADDERITGSIGTDDVNVRIVSVHLSKEARGTLKLSIINSSFANTFVFVSERKNSSGWSSSGCSFLFGRIIGAPTCVGISSSRLDFDSNSYMNPHAVIKT